MKLCVQTGDVVDRLGFDKGYAAIKNAGFSAVDWNLDHALKESDLEKGTYKGTCIFEKSLDEVIAHYAEELSYIRKYDLVINQAHAPFPTYTATIFPLNTTSRFTRECLNTWIMQVVAML